MGDGFADYRALSNSDKTQFDFIMSRYASNVYNGVLLRQEGMLDDVTLDQIGGWLAIVAASASGSVWWDAWPQPQEVRTYVAEYRPRNPGPLPQLHEMIPHWVPAPASGGESA